MVFRDNGVLYRKRNRRYTGKQKYRIPVAEIPLIWFSVYRNYGIPQYITRYIVIPGRVANIRYIRLLIVILLYVMCLLKKKAPYNQSWMYGVPLFPIEKTGRQDYDQ